MITIDLRWSDCDFRKIIGVESSYTFLEANGQIQGVGMRDLAKNPAGALFRFLPPEWSRRAGLSAMAAASRLAISTESTVSLLDHALGVDVPGFGHLPHPVGLGAGFERDGARLRALGAMGFSFAEIGSVLLTAEDRISLPVIGDRTGRGIRLGNAAPHEVERATWPSGNETLDAVANRVSEFNHGPLAINIEVPLQVGPVRAVAMVLGAFQRLRKNGFPVVVLSWGIPRSPDSSASQAAMMVAVLEALASEAALLLGFPVWVKLAPNLAREDFQNIVDTIASLGYQGIVAGSARHVSWPEAAIVSGSPALSVTNQLLEWGWAVHKGTLPMIGSGGITTGEEAFQKILRGAAAVEILTALWLRGPLAAKMIRSELHAEMRRFGATKISDCVGGFY